MIIIQVDNYFPYFIFIDHCRNNKEKTIGIYHCATVQRDKK